MKGKPSTYPLRLPASLKAAVEKASKGDGTSINQFVVTAVAEKISAMNTAEFFREKRAQGDLALALEILGRKGGQDPLEEDRL